MAQVECQIERVTLYNDDNRQVFGIEATCSRCDHVTQCFGTTSRSVRRALLMMREDCPRNEENYYKADDESDEE